MRVFDDLRRVGVSILTIGRYLRPSAQHAGMEPYDHADEFAGLERIALGKGFVHVESGPLARSSYHAHERPDAFDAARVLQRTVEEVLESLGEQPSARTVPG